MRNKYLIEVNEKDNEGGYLVLEIPLEGVLGQYGVVKRIKTNIRLVPYEEDDPWD